MNDFAYRTCVMKELCDSGILNIDNDGIVYYDGIVRNQFLADGYATVKLKGCMIPVHKIMAYIKFGNNAIMPGIVTRHLDNDKSNNNCDNIGIGSQLENSRDIPHDVRSKYASIGRMKISPEIRINLARAAALSVPKDILSQRMKKLQASYTKEERAEHARDGQLNLPKWYRSKIATLRNLKRYKRISEDEYNSEYIRLKSKRLLDK